MNFPPYLPNQGFNYPVKPNDPPVPPMPVGIPGNNPYFFLPDKIIPAYASSAAHAAAAAAVAAAMKAKSFSKLSPGVSPNLPFFMPPEPPTVAHNSPNVMANFDPAKYVPLKMEGKALKKNITANQRKLLSWRLEENGDKTRLKKMVIEHLKKEGYTFAVMRLMNDIIRDSGGFEVITSASEANLVAIASKQGLSLVPEVVEKALLRSVENIAGVPSNTSIISNVDTNEEDEMKPVGDCANSVQAESVEKINLDTNRDEGSAYLGGSNNEDEMTAGKSHSCSRSVSASPSLTPRSSISSKGRNRDCSRSREGSVNRGILGRRMKAFVAMRAGRKLEKSLSYGESGSRSGVNKIVRSSDSIQKKRRKERTERHLGQKSRSEKKRKDKKHSRGKRVL